MRHSSIMLDTPCEFINVVPINPLISKCQIKVCYVGETPNRNKTVITKEVATEMANSLPGSPIVGFYNQETKDFEEHNRILDISEGKIKLIDTTRPYGFVDLNAKVWFQKFLDDGEFEREYLMTEGYLWTGQYPEVKRVITQGNNQSMELSKEFFNGEWAKDINGNKKFFIINEAIIEKLCILGDDEEPCFEGATIESPIIQFSFDDGFKEQLFSMMNELKNLIKEGGEAPVFTTFAVELGSDLWSAVYDFLDAKYPREDVKEGYSPSKFCPLGIWEEGTQKFIIMKDRADGKLYRLNFVYTEEGFTSEEEPFEVKVNYVPVEENSFSEEEIENFEQERYKKVDISEKENSDNSDNSTKGSATSYKEEDEGEEEICPKCKKPLSECTCKEYSLDDIPEYVKLAKQYNEISNNYELLKQEKENLLSQVQELVEFKNQVDRKEKENMIESFYMLSEADKQDVIDNIDTYSLDQIEAKLSIICVRNKVNFNLEDNAKTKEPTTYSLRQESESVPAWIKSVQSVAKDIK